MNKKIKIVMGVCLAMIMVSCIVGFLIAYIPSKMSEKHTNDIANVYFEDTGFDVELFENKWQEQIQAFKITSDLGHTIPVYYIAPNGNNHHKTVVLVHWHESNHVAMYPIAQMFLENGWNVVLYDQRAHGKNTAQTVTFGYLESLDLAQVVNFTKDKAGSNIVGVFGQSMGAATVGYYLGSEEAQKNLSFAVMDCPYSGMYDEIAWEISKGKVPLIANGLTSLGSSFCKGLYGYSFEDVNITKQIKNSNTPTLLIHSKADQKCPYYMAQDIFEAIPHDKKKLITYESSAHLFSFWDEPERYEKELIYSIKQFTD